MSDIKRAHAVLLATVLDGDGAASIAQRRAAFENTVLAEPLRTLVDTVARHASTITDADVTAVRAAGLTDDQIFEIVVCAAIGQSTRQYNAARAALDAATREA